MPELATIEPQAQPPNDRGSAPFRSLKPRQRRFLDVLAHADSIADACRQTKVPERTAMDWLKRDNFKLCYQACMDIAVPDIELAHFRAAKGKDTLARIHILKNRHPAYREKPIEVNVHPDHIKSNLALAQAQMVTAKVLSDALRLLVGNMGQLPVEHQAIIQADVVPVEPLSDGK